MSNYKSAIKRIQEATTLQELSRVDKGLVRVYQVGFFSEYEFALLDHMLGDKFYSLSNQIEVTL
tara:strand:+ start:351 stop:542 length:192 start_codon:yes stop_codon:yes gene_type:complete